MVRGDLPAAVRLARRLRAAAQPAAPARRARPAAGARRATSAGCRSHDAGRPTQPPSEVLDARRARRCAAPRFRVDVADGLGRRREGLPARDRQPGLPPGAAAAARRGGRRAPVRATRATSWSSRARRSPTPCRPTTRSTPGRARRRGSLRAVHGRRSTTSKVRYQPSGHAARRAARLPGARSATRPTRTRREQSYDLRVNHPLRSTAQGLPARQRLRAGVHGARQQRRGRVRTARCRSCRGTATTPRPASSRCTGADAADRLRRALPAHRGHRRRHGPISIYPGLSCRAALLSVSAATSGVDGGTPQSVYTPRQGRLTQVRSEDGRKLVVGLAPGTSVTLPSGGTHHVRRRPPVDHAAGRARPGQRARAGRRAARAGRPDARRCSSGAAGSGSGPRPTRTGVRSSRSAGLARTEGEDGDGLADEVARAARRDRDRDDGSWCCTVTSESLADLSNNLLYSAMAVYAGAMYCYAAELAFGSPRPPAASRRGRGARAGRRRRRHGVRRRHRRTGRGRRRRRRAAGARRPARPDRGVADGAGLRCCTWRPSWPAGSRPGGRRGATCSSSRRPARSRSPGSSSCCSPRTDVRYLGTVRHRCRCC